MIDIGAILVGFVLGVFALGLLVFLVVLHKPRPAAPTLRRRNRDRPVPYVAPSWERELPEEPIYMYGVTGEER